MLNYYINTRNYNITMIHNFHILKNEVILLLKCLKFYTYSIHFDIIFPNELIKYIIDFYVRLYQKPILSCGSKHSFLLHNAKFIDIYNKNKNVINDINIGNIKSFSCGFDHTLILTDKGFYGYGETIMNQLNGCCTLIRDCLYKIDMDDVKSFSAGFIYSLIYRNDGLYEYGDYGFITYIYALNFNFENGLLVKKITLDGKIISFKADIISMILTTDGLYGKGTNDYCQLGNNNIINLNIYNKVHINNVIDYHTSGTHTLFLTENGLYGCGLNVNQQLGFKCEPKKIVQQEIKKIDIEYNNIQSFYCSSLYSLVLTNTCNLLLFNEGIKKIRWEKILTINTDGNLFYCIDTKKRLIKINPSKRCILNM